MIAFDEFGRPFVILKDQSTKKRLAGIQAQKVVLIPSAVLVRVCPLLCFSLTCSSYSPIFWRQKQLLIFSRRH